MLGTHVSIDQVAVPTKKSCRRMLWEPIIIPRPSLVIVLSGLRSNIRLFHIHEKDSVADAKATETLLRNLGEVMLSDHD